MSSVSSGNHISSSPVREMTRRLALWQAGLALAASELALTYSNHGLRGAMLLFAVSAFWLWLIAQWGRSPEIRLIPRHWILPLLVFMGVLEIVRLLIQPWEFPLELAALLTLRTLCLILALFVSVPVCMRSLGGASVCLILFSSCLTESRLGISLLLVYSVVAGIWLLSLYWGDVERDLPMESAERLPWTVVGWGWGCVILLVVLLTAGRDVTRQVVAELVGSSGGTGLQDQRAKSGVNDGDNLVDAQENATTTGFSESDVFLDSDERTLYDAADDRYGGDVRKKRDLQRSINIGSADKVRKEQQNTQSLQRRKEFGMRREGNKSEKSPKNSRADEKIDALFCVHGPTPLHLKVNVFAEMQEDALIECLPHREDRPFIPGFGGWLKLRLPPFETQGGRVRHEIRVANLKSPQVLVPNGLRSFRMGFVNREDFFRLTDLGTLLLDDGIVPDGTTVETEAFVPEPEYLQTVVFPEEPGYALPLYHHSLVSAEFQPLWQRTAREWAAGLPRGWRQIEAICQRLREDYELKVSSPHSSPELKGDLLKEFLVSTRSGPDYLFATAAVALFRELKYPSRIVGGFYADPRKYVEADGHVYVRSEDLHFWTEVCLPDGLWVTVDPSPGYEVLGPQPDWSEVIADALLSFAEWGSRHSGFIAGLLLLAGISWQQRFQLLDRLMTCWWSCKCSNSPEACLEGTWELLQYRALWAGRGRRPSETVRQFLERLDPLSEPARFHLQVLLESWMYLPSQRKFSFSPDSERELRALCRKVVVSWSLKRLKQIKTSPVAIEKLHGQQSDSPFSISHPPLITHS